MRALWMPWRDRRSNPIVIGRDDGSGERIPALATTPRSSPCSSSVRPLARPARPALTGGAARCSCRDAREARPARVRPGCGRNGRRFHGVTRGRVHTGDARTFSGAPQSDGAHRRVHTGCRIRPVPACPAASGWPPGSERADEIPIGGKDVARHDQHRTHCGRFPWGRHTRVGTLGARTHRHAVSDAAIRHAVLRDVDRLTEVLGDPVTDVRRAALAGHVGFLLDQLQAHHRLQDEVIWPRVAARAGRTLRRRGQGPGVTRRPRRAVQGAPPHGPAVDRSTLRPGPTCWTP